MGTDDEPVGSYCRLPAVLVQTIGRPVGNATQVEQQEKGWRLTNWQSFGLGSTLALVLLGGLAETYLRWFPSGDIQAYQGDRSALAGIYLPDDDFGITYRSWAAFYEDNTERMKPFLPFQAKSDGPIWAFFGNSFVQAPGMLADHIRQTVQDKRVFNLGRNEPLPVRLAQIKLLLENGLEPERIFVELMPTDTLSLGVQPLATIHVTSRGAFTYRPRFPANPAACWVLQHSQLATTAWMRAGLHRGNPHFRKDTLYEGVEQPLLGDLNRLFANLARLTQEHHVPVTIILIPAYHQVLAGASFGFQDTLGSLLRQQGYDVFDPRDAFRHIPNAQALFLPDKHFTALGNQLLAAELLAHVHARHVLAESGTNSGKL